MEDPILTLRLSILEQNLQTVHEKTTNLLDELKEANIGSRLREALRSTFEKEIQRQLNALKETRKIVDNAEGVQADVLRGAWKQYCELCEQSTHICREFVEVVGGLAIRRQRLDEEICNLADELIGKLGVKGDSFTIPASQEAYSRTLARLVRVRFPEWTIWALPLAVHEFGHVVIDDSWELRTFAEREVQMLEAAPVLNHDAPITDASENTGRDAARRLSKGRINQLLADAFAVYTVGPSYPCSLVFLRLNPLVPSSEGCHAPDAERAFMALEILRKMDELFPNQPLYHDIIQKLGDSWAAMCTRLGVNSLPAEREVYLREFACRIWRVFDAELIPGRYEVSATVGSGWNIARRWYDEWRDYNGGGRLPLSNNVSANNRLRDALNAAWIYRLFVDQANLDRVANATLELSNEIVGKWYEQEKKEAEKKAKGRKVASRA